jgi:uroporphyrinogen-III synthase
MINRLNLLYYEYNVNSHTFIPDTTYTPSQRYDELMKLTYELSKNKLDYEVKKDKSVILVDKRKVKKGFIKQILESFTMKIKIKNMNIFTLGDKKVQNAKSLPVYKINYLESDIDFTKYDALVFTSKNSVMAIDSFNKNWRSIPAYTIASGTAKTVKRLGGKLKFVGITKHGNEFASELVGELDGKKVLYLRGKTVVSNLIEILDNAKINCDNVVVYENVCNTDLKIKELPLNSYIIFSSPSTIDCFLKNFEWKPSYKAISIGHTTAKYFPEYINPIISYTTSIDSCVNKAIELELSSNK